MLSNLSNVFSYTFNIDFYDSSNNIADLKSEDDNIKVASKNFPHQVNVNNNLYGLDRNINMACNPNYVFNNGTMNSNGNIFGSFNTSDHSNSNLFSSGQKFNYFNNNLYNQLYNTQYGHFLNQFPSYNINSQNYNYMMPIQGYGIPGFQNPCAQMTTTTSIPGKINSYSSENNSSSTSIPTEFKNYDKFNGNKSAFSKTYSNCVSNQVQFQENLHPNSISTNDIKKLKELGLVDNSSDANSSENDD